MLACADGAGMGFLSRAKAEDLRVIPEDESAPALEEALLAAGPAIEGGVLSQLLDAAQGHAALLHCIWHSLASLPSGTSITSECARRCVQEAQARLSHKLLGGVSVPAPALLSVLAKSRKLQALGSVAAELHRDEAAAVSAADGLKDASSWKRPPRAAWRWRIPFSGSICWSMRTASLLRRPRDLMLRLPHGASRGRWLWHR